MKKVLAIIMCVVLVTGVVFAMTACDGTSDVFAKLCGNEEVTYKYEGKNSYIIGEEFENGKVVASNGKEFEVSKDDVTGFSTAESTGNSKFSVTVNEQTLEFPYFVCMAVQKLDKDDAVITDGVYVYKDLDYGTRKVDPKDYGKNTSFWTSNTAKDQIYDAYLPAAIDKLDKDTPVLLYVHGGGWIMGDKDSEGPQLCTRYAQNGFAVFSMNYDMQVMTGKSDCSMDDIVSDIGTMVAYLKNLLPTLGIDATKIAIGGVSAGGHLSSLYAYTMNDYSPLKIGFEVDIVGPNHFSDPAYQALVEDMLHSENTTTGTASAGATVKKMLAAAFPSIIKGLLGESGKDIDLSGDLTAMWAAADVYSPVLYIDEDTCPTICAYGKVDVSTATGLAKTIADLGFFADDVENDLLVPVNSYREMMAALEENNVPHVGKLFEGLSHLEVGQTPETQEWLVEQSLEYAKLYL